jgi:hypothetical protein
MSEYEATIYTNNGPRNLVLACTSMEVLERLAKLLYPEASYVNVRYIGERPA